MASLTRHRGPLLGAVMVTACAFAAAACSSGGGSSTTAASGPGFSAPASSSGTLTLGLARQLTSLDPGQSGSIDSDADVQATIFSSLTAVNAQQQVVGDLATSWKQVSATEWTFHIRSGVKFSNGDPLTASTIVWNFTRVLNPNANPPLELGGTLQGIISHATAPNATTVDVFTKNTYLDLPATLSTFYFTQEAWVKSHNPTLQPLGSGPYKLVSVNLETGAQLVRNPYYYGPKPYYDKVDFKVLATEAARVAAVQTHAVDVLLQLEPDDLSQAAKAGYKTGDQASSWDMVFRLNETKAPLNNRDVRLALNYAINKALIARSLLGSSIKPSPGQVLVPGYDDTNPALKAYPYDPAKAKALLKAAGYAHGLTLTLNNATGTYIASDTVAQAVAQELGQVGVHIQISDTPFPTWVDESRTPQAADLLYIGYSSGYPGPAERLLIYTSSYSQSHYSDPAYDALVQKVFSATTKAQQQRYVDEATQQFYTAANVIFLWPQPLTYAVARNLAWTPRKEHWLLPQDIRPAAS